MPPGRGASTRSCCGRTAGRPGPSTTWCLPSCWPRTSRTGCCYARSGLRPSLPPRGPLPRPFGPPPLRRLRTETPAWILAVVPSTDQAPPGLPQHACSLCPQNLVPPSPEAPDRPHSCRPGPGPAVPVLPGPDRHRHVAAEQQQPLPQLPPQPAARVPVPRPHGLSVHRRPPAVPLHQGQTPGGQAGTPSSGLQGWCCPLLGERSRPGRVPGEGWAQGPGPPA